LIGLLLDANLLSAARVVLIRLINGNVPVLPCGLRDSRVAIADAMASLSLCFDEEIRRKMSDLLIEVYCTQFKRDGCYLALDVFPVLANKGMFPSKTTCNILLTSLVRANEFQKCCEAFDVVCKGVSPDVYLFTTAINAFCKGGKVEEAVKLFSKMEEAGVAPNVVTFNTVIDGLGMCGRYDEAFMFKERW
jgi:pentatricopeptide repeat protein